VVNKDQAIFGVMALLFVFAFIGCKTDQARYRDGRSQMHDSLDSMRYGKEHKVHPFMREAIDGMIQWANDQAQPEGMPGNCTRLSDDSWECTIEDHE